MLQVAANGQLVGRMENVAVGSIIVAANKKFRVMKIETLPVMDFIFGAISGFDKLGFDEIILDELGFVTGAENADGIAELVGGRVTMVWVNEVKE